MFQESFKGVSMENKECFKEDLKALQGSLKDISKKFQRCFRGCFKSV